MLNPLLVKEFREQARGWKYLTAGASCVLIISILAFGLIWNASTGKKAINPEYGRNMFFIFIIALTTIMCTVCPAFTVGAISSERERLTHDLLRVTLLKPRHVITGKTVPALVYAMILLLASLPVIILIMPAGGASLIEIGYCYLTIFASVAAFSLTGLMWSSVFRSTRTSAAVTYTCIGFFIFGTMLAPAILDKVFHLETSHILLRACITLNPFLAAASSLGRTVVVSDLTPVQVFGLPVWTMTVLCYLVISVIAISIAKVKTLS